MQTSVTTPGDGVSLDNLTLGRKEGWRAFAEALRPEMPRGLSVGEIAGLDPGERDAYNRGRAVWHANLGPFRTPQLAAVHEQLWDIFESNMDEGDKAKGMIALDAYPGLGKTTAALAFGRDVHRREIERLGPVTGAGHERWPVCRIGLSGSTGIRDLNRAILKFYAHQGADRGSAADFAHRALDCILSCETRLLIIDELHFLRGHGTSRSAIEVGNHFKYIANEFPVTLLFVGIALESRGLLSDGDIFSGTAAGPGAPSFAQAAMAQFEWRTTRLGMNPFAVQDATGREQWRSLLLVIEQRLVLARKHPGFLADELSDELFARTSGHIGSLMTLVRRAAIRAIRTGTEVITAQILAATPNAVAPQGAYPGLKAKLDAGRISTRDPRGRTSAGAVR